MAPGVRQYGLQSVQTSITIRGRAVQYVIRNTGDGSDMFTAFNPKILSNDVWFPYSILRSSTK